MELYFTADCRSARGQLHSDMISYQSREGGRNAGPEISEGWGVNELLCNVILLHKKEATASNNQLSISDYFPLYVAVSIFSFIFTSVSLSVSCRVSLGNYHSVTVMRTLALSFFIFSVLFISWKSSVTALCVIPPVLVV